MNETPTEKDPIDPSTDADAPLSPEEGGPVPGGLEPPDPLDALKTERDDLESRLLRVSADYQNFVRRSNQNISDAREQQLLEVARQLVNVLDQFDLAISVDPKKTTPENMIKGVTMVRDELVKTLEGFGIQRVTVKPGEEFDPNRHEALMRQPAEGVKSNHVAMQLQVGYVLRDRTIRPAKVSVAE